MQPSLEPPRISESSLLKVRLKMQNLKSPGGARGSARCGVVWSVRGERLTRWRFSHQEEYTRRSPA